MKSIFLIPKNSLAFSIIPFQYSFFVFTIHYLLYLRGGLLAVNYSLFTHNRLPHQCPLGAIIYRDHGIIAGLQVEVAFRKYDHFVL